MDGARALLDCSDGGVGCCAPTERTLFPILVLMLVLMLNLNVPCWSWSIHAHVAALLHSPLWRSRPPVVAVHPLSSPPRPTSTSAAQNKHSRETLTGIGPLLRWTTILERAPCAGCTRTMTASRVRVRVSTGRVPATTAAAAAAIQGSRRMRLWDKQACIQPYR